MRFKKITFFIILIAVIIAAIFFFTQYFLFTTAGSSVIVKFALSKYIPSESINFKKAEGNIMRVFSYTDIVFNDLESLPKGSVLKIQRLDITPAALSHPAFAINIFNGRLTMPMLDIILFDGFFRDGKFDINVYSKNVAVREILGLFTKDSGIKKISGLINDLDVYIKGTLFEPELTGTFKIKKLLREGFSMIDVSGNFNLRLKDFTSRLKLFGVVSLDNATVFGPNTATVNIEKGKIIFNADPKNPSLDLRGVSMVEGVKINIIAKGSFEKPQLHLSSEPALGQDKLLIMLATGKTWKAVEGSLSQGHLSADLAKDFIDYFIFSGSGAKLAELLGVSDISLGLEKDKKTFGFKKAVSDKINATYDVEQAKGKEGEIATTQKAGGEYKISDNVSIGVKKELKGEDKTGQPQDKQKTDDEINVKFKKAF